MLLITIDPVTFRTTGNVGGWAVWECDYTNTPGPYDTAGLVNSKLKACAAFDSRSGVPDGADECVIETPMHYPDSPTPPQDLIDLAFDTGLIASCGRVLTTVTPNAWKGNLPKEQTERRARKLLTDEELEFVEVGLKDLRKSWHHNVWDAVALGLWRTGRMPRR